jgi:hypothetical protein
MFRERLGGFRIPDPRLYSSIFALEIKATVLTALSTKVLKVGVSCVCASCTSLTASFRSVAVCVAMLFMIEWTCLAFVLTAAQAISTWARDVVSTLIPFFALVIALVMAGLHLTQYRSLCIL